LWGSSSSMRLFRCVGNRVSTSLGTSSPTDGCSFKQPGPSIARFRPNPEIVNTL
jgi:hypothetical protein